MSTKDATKNAPSARQIKKGAENLRKTGAFKTELPDVFIASTHFRRAQRGLKEVKIDNTIKNQRDRNRRFSAQTMDAIMKGLSKPITQSLNSYKNVFRTLHPFEATVADLVVRSRVKKGHPPLDELMSSLKALRAETSRTAKDFASRANKAPTSIEAKDLLIEGMDALSDLYNSTRRYDMCHCLAELVELQKDLRRIPVLELDTLTVVLVGTPNVGKSSIVRSVSTGQPEVNNYPFTTRSVTIGHVVDDERDLRFQVMDTPGLLDRPDGERNEMEKLTYASLAHLPTAVIYVIDPSGLSGEQHSSLEAQLRVRETLRKRFPRRPWLDVVSKGDLEIPAEVTAKIQAACTEGYLSVSVLNGLNMNELKGHIERMLLKDLQEMLVLMEQARGERDRLIREEIEREQEDEERGEEAA